MQLGGKFGKKLSQSEDIFVVGKQGALQMKQRAVAGSVRSFIRSFHEHPQGVGQTYLQHFIFASSFSVKLLAASVTAMVHAFVPALFENTTSRAIGELQATMHKQISDD